jgi:excinuclease ABC subunit C
MVFDPKTLDSYPTYPGVYLMRDSRQKILYIGKAINLRGRLKQYFIPGRDGRKMIPHLTRSVETIETIVVGSEKEALLLEANLIKQHQPKYNVHLKDDKRFFSLMINHQHQWPMIRVVRFKGTPPKGNLYFGPYTDALAARATLKLLRDLFPLRQCSDHELRSRTRPCILYEMKKCCAPCVNKCSKEEYSEHVEGVVEFLKGQDTPILKRLIDEREKAVESLKFEEAQKIHRMITAIERTLEKQRVEKAGSVDKDALGIFRYGEHVMLSQLIFKEGRLTASKGFSFKQLMGDDAEILTSFILQHYETLPSLPKEILVPIELPLAEMISSMTGNAKRSYPKIVHPQRGARRELVEMAAANARVKFEQYKESLEKTDQLLLKLQEECKLINFPEKIDCIDQSSLSGTEPVSAIVRFLEGKPNKKHYRTFKLKETKAGDDYGGMEEVIRRHYAKCKELPDLLLVDGGKGHLKRALSVLGELDISTIDVIAVAKEEGRHDKGITNEQIFLPGVSTPLILKKHSPLLFLLQRIRDEAHRFAITFQKKRRTKTTFKSELDHLMGIGPTKKKMLLSHFGSIKRILAADEEEWAALKGISKKDVETLAEWKKSKL